MLHADPAVTPRHVMMTADAVGGVWRYSIDLGAALAGRGVRTTIALMGPAPDAAQRREADRAGLTMVERPFRLEWMEEPWQDVERAGDWLLSLERTLQPDVVHLNGYSHAALPWSAPVMVVAHSCVGSWWRAVKGSPAPARFDTYRASVSKGLASAHLVVAPTHAMLAALHREYGPPAAARVIANGMPGTACAGLLPGKEPLILAAGRLWDEGKNVDAVCSVAAQWRWPVYVAGDQHAPDGTGRSLAGVQTLGRLTPEELGTWRRRAAIYVSPARYEPFGLSILEAAGSGCALVLGDIPSLRENWEGAAVFVPPDDREALRVAVGTLIEDAAGRDDLARRARQRAAAFTMDRAADAYLRAYQDLVA